MNDAVRCANQQCPVAKNGKCLEGLAVEECPHYGHDPAISIDASEHEEPRSPTATLVPQVIEGRLPTADLLSPVQAGSLCCARRVYSIAFVGPSEAGKTSLIASFYDMFQSGPFEGYSFKWCDSYHGFERACHHSRLASQRTIPYTARTDLRAGLRYYQMTLRKDGTDLDLLFADRAGELYNGAANNPSLVSSFEELRRADSIALLLDGSKLADPGARHVAKSDLEMTLHGIVDSGVLGAVRRLAIVLTKLDVLRTSARAEAAQREFAEFASKLCARYGAYFKQIEPFQISSNPSEQAGLQRGHGLAKLFQYWIDESPVKISETASELPLRQFQRLGTAGGATR